MLFFIVGAFIRTRKNTPSISREYDPLELNHFISLMKVCLFKKVLENMGPI